VGGFSEDNTEAIREYFGALRPWVAVLVLMVYFVPLLAAITYNQTLSDRDSMLFWLGGDKFFFFVLVFIAFVWGSHVSVFALTRRVRGRQILLVAGADQLAFDRRSRECSILWSVIFGLYLALFCVLEWS
jgi:ribose/xylose/arabinose/galactoside ABC-type transport system permease subunit